MRLRMLFSESLRSMTANISTTMAASPSPYVATAAATPSTSLYRQTIVSAAKIGRAHV